MTETSKKKDSEKSRLQEKIHVPLSRMMTLLPVLGVVSVAALVVVLVLGIIMLQTLTGETSKTADHSSEMQKELRNNAEKMKQLEDRINELTRKLGLVENLANQLFLERPTTEEEKKKAKLAVMAPAELLREGMLAMMDKEGRPVPYFETILERYPEETEAETALFQLGLIRAKNADYREAVELLERYLDYSSGENRHRDAQAYFFIAFALRCGGKNTSAVEYFEKAEKMMDKDDIQRATTLMNLGETHLDLGKTEKAGKVLGTLINDFESQEAAANMVKRAKKLMESAEQ